MVEDKKRVITAILDWNPWFAGAFPVELEGFDREIDIVKYLDYKEIKILEGPRRSGKSTLLYKVLHALHNAGEDALYINFDDEALRDMTLDEVFAIFSEHKEVKHLFVDEIQNCKSWVPFVRKAYDTRMLEQIWITGSNSNLIKSEYATYLTGRNIKLHISPLSFKEFLSFRGITYDGALLSNVQRSQVRRLFAEYVEYGGFPEVVLRIVGKKELLMNYYEDFLYKDIVSRYGADAEKLRGLSTFLHTNASKRASYRNISKMLDINYETVTKYVSYFTEVYLLSLLYRFDYSVRKHITSDKKIYALDTGLANAVSFRFSEDYGRQLESVVYTQLRRLGGEVYYHRDDASECDFILKHKERIVGAIQVSADVSSEQTRTREVRGLLNAMERYELKDALILTDDEDVEEVHDGKRIRFMPVWQWLLSGGDM